MAYIVNDEHKPISQRICDINNMSLEKLDVSNFFVDYDNHLLKEFMDKLMVYRDEKFLIVGDYDCDGICSTSIIKKLLNDLNIQNNYYIPSRSLEGYGLNKKIVQTAIDNDFKAMIMLDCGVSSYEELAYAKANDIKCFVIDHHEYSDKPDVEGFLHPALFKEEYIDMCASGLCAYLANSVRHDDYSIVLGGIGTLADMVSVLNYNRYLLKEMLKLLNKGCFYQINLLAKNNHYDYDDLSFNVIPKINAVSRLDNYMNVNMLVRYLLSDEQYCISHIKDIDTINDMRKKLSKNMFEIAENKINENDDFIIVNDDEFVEGICGLIANRIMMKYHKPVIVLSNKGDLLLGSGRCPNSFNIYEYLSNCEELFDSFGGHSSAIGLSINKQNMDILKKYIENHPIEIQDKKEDVILLDNDEINFDLFNEINLLKPFGTDFKQPLLCLKNVDFNKKFFVANKYPKYYVSQICDAIDFNGVSLNGFDAIIGKLTIDNYHKNKLSLLIEDVF